LSHNRIFRVSDKGLDFQILLDPLEEELNLPAFSVNIANRLGRESEIVGQKNIVLPRLETQAGRGKEFQPCLNTSTIPKSPSTWTKSPVWMTSVGSLSKSVTVGTFMFMAAKTVRLLPLR